MTNWEQFKYDLADFFFGKQMDEAYEQGIRIGAEYATRHISFRMGIKESRLQLTKTEARGYTHALNIMESCKEDITRTTGAML